ncbi:ABC transporter substrate-binding protein [Comamonas terrigena]|uniref:ABC transporter substrate-binding protein n=1 Tax=Comamonas terrigena TaxID=32013 RepID=A0A2A7US25_COMTR|nr:ABC transporter substrate-binding protein [Comamonas terrigena]MDH1704168.1 ABC transporter substrate-binding protein [Comamonas terrigena]PEH87996.1 ABC transporter substrate-binding protein [Comamonas terrigena]BBL22897.1 branched chain amino acid ABC transporter substrate-binding protein [Comamonas terrigena NBRC 13299]SUY92146.1 Leucine-, isoleucine-, valine-, threonine-, and alanine-binding protein precursor [Comamonas terrigena]
MTFKMRSFYAATALLGTLSVTPVVQAQETVNMGAVLSLTGANATVGEDVRRAVMLAVDKVNADGGVLGKKFGVIVEDSGGNPTTALNAARKLASVDKVPVVIGEYSSGITLPMAQYLVKEGVGHINVASTSTKVRELGASSFNLIGLENLGNQFSAADTWALGYRKVAMIAPNNAYGQGVAHGFKQEFEKLGGKVVTELLYTAGQSTYRRELQQVSRSAPDAYIYTAYGQESAVLNREAYELGLRKSPWYAILLSMSLSDTPANIANGQLGMEVGNVYGDAGKAYQAAFNAKYKEGTKTSYTGYAYDAVLMTAAAMNKAKSTDTDKVQAALKDLGKGGYVGVTGPIVFDAERQRIDPPYAKLKYDGKVVPR